MNRKIKIIILILLVISFILVLFFGIFGTSLSFLSTKEIKENRKLKKNLITELKINKTDAVYDKKNNIYYYMIPENFENKIYTLNIELGDEFKYKIVGETLNIINVNYKKQIKVIIYNDKYYYETKIQLTNLPLINIKTKDDITTNDVKNTFTYINSENEKKQISENSLIHIRGASSKHFPKKSYKIKFYNDEYTKEKNINISKFYYGNSFILDAVYRDPSKIRNVLSTSLWNNISNDFTNVNINSEFVELFINNEHIGLYVLTEPINRKSLKLNKSNDNDTSLIIKTNGWNTVGVNTDFSNINDSTYIDYEIKYPNDEKLYSKSWYNFLNLISNYYNPNIKNTNSIINNTFNIENYLDIIIFNSFTNNMDSCLMRNTYFYMKSIDDNQVYIQPWDMEFTYGYYSRKELLPSIKYDKIYCTFYHEDIPKINKLLINRYWQLRKDILTKKYFDNLLDEYKNKLSKGAALRDSKIWYEYDIEKEIEDIRTWLYKRLDFFDKYIEDLENE